MGNGLVTIVLAAWVPVVVILFRAIGPRRAALIAVIGGLLFLPRISLVVRSIPFDKRTVTGLGLILAVALFGRRDLVRARPRWLDLPIVAFALAPLVGLVTGVPGSGADIFNLAIERMLGWVVPYAVGRLYFGDAEGARQVAVAIVLGGLAYIPLCVFEEIAGPGRYLSGWLYGTEYLAGMVDRLGGWRPEAFLTSGLEVASWMALATVTAAWLWLGAAWRVRGVPAWAPALALALTTLSCRGVYGYLTMTLGLATAFATRFLRTRAVLVALALLNLGYIGLRLSGTWDGAALARWASATGRAGTVTYRLDAEDQVIRKVVTRDLAFGFGNYIWHGDLSRWPDGLWLHHLWNGGLVGLVATMGALHLVPATLTILRPRGRPTRSEASSPSWGLAGWSLLLMADELHNTHYFFPLGLIAGSLVGPSPGSGGAATGHARYSIGSPATRAGREPPGRRAFRLVVLACLLAIPELVALAFRLLGPG